MSPFGGSDNIFVFAVSVVAGIRVLGNKLHLSYSASSIRSGVDPKCGSQHVAAASLQSTADRNAFLCSFCAQLLEIEEQLNERIGTASTRHSRTVWQLLEHLERMLKLQDTVHPAKQAGPTLEERYPILWSLYAANQHDRVTKGLRNFSRLNSIIHRRFLKSLKTFNKISPSSFTLENSRPDTGTPNDDRVYIKALHSAVKGIHCESPSCSGYTLRGHHGNSTNAFKPSKLRHAARLRLQAQRATPTSNNTVNFDMLFKKAGSGLGWQDIQLTVHRQIRTRWESDNVTERKENLKWFTNTRFCGFLRDEEEKRLLIAVKKKGASYCFIYPPTIIDKDPQHTSSGKSVSLAAILDEHTMTWQMKLVLAVFLVNSVWQFYDSPWMKTSWDKHNIHFIDHEGLYANHPYLVADINENPITHELDNQSALPPKIFALAIMLLEIGLGIPFEKWPSQHSTSSTAHPGREYDPHYLYKLALQVALLKRPSGNCPIMSTECYLPYRKAIQTCLSLAKFNSDNEDDHRQILYEEVVLPLEACLRGSWEPADAILLDPIPRKGDWNPKKQRLITSKPDAEPLPPEFSAVLCSTDIAYDIPNRALSGLHLPEPPRPKFGFHVHRAAQNLEGEQGSDQWLQFLEKNIHIRILKNRGSPAPDSDRPIRIAILDTGCDANTSFFQERRNIKRLKGYSSWVERPAVHAEQDNILTHAKDSSGHGTHSTALLVRTAPHADIYVARIAESSKDLPSVAGNISEAIEYATKKWEVDIISMSFGFSGTVKPIKKAISDAVYQRDEALLLFAAACNNGKNCVDTFPASNPLVISIRATNHNGEFLDYNPFSDPAKDGRYFGTLGDNVVSAWRVEDATGSRMRCQSGTSVATPIAAGIAASMLEYIRHVHRCREERLVEEMGQAQLGAFTKTKERLEREIAAGRETFSDMWDKVRTKEGIKALFSIMSRTEGRKSFVTPEALFLKGGVLLEDEEVWSEIRTAMRAV